MKLFCRFLVLGLVISNICFAKIKPFQPWKPRPVPVSFIKDISGGASLVVHSKLELSRNKKSIEFQNGKMADSINFFGTPRCYLHFKNKSENQLVEAGVDLKVSKIDNIYSKGSVHVTFWFDQDPFVSDLSCITNYNHTLTAAELKDTLGSYFEMNLTQSIEKEALINTVPQKNAPTLLENSPAHHSLHSARFILSGF